MQATLCPVGYVQEDGVKFWANHRDKSTPSTVAECAARCNDDNNCVAFNRAAASQNCWLYSDPKGAATSGTIADGLAGMQAHNGAWTNWLDRDDPSGNEDNEAYIYHQVMTVSSVGITSRANCRPERLQNVDIYEGSARCATPVMV